MDKFSIQETAYGPVKFRVQETEWGPMLYEFRVQKSDFGPMAVYVVQTWTGEYIATLIVDHHGRFVCDCPRAAGHLLMSKLTLEGYFMEG